MIVRILRSDGQEPAQISTKKGVEKMNKVKEWLNGHDIETLSSRIYNKYLGPIVAEMILEIPEIVELNSDKYLLTSCESDLVRKLLLKLNWFLLKNGQVATTSLYLMIL